MRAKRLMVGAMVAAIALGPAASMARPHPSGQPSQYCDGSTPQNNAKVRIDTTQPAVCLDLLQNGDFKGGAWADTTHNSIVWDGDSSNYSGRLGPCSSGYVGVSLGDSGTDPHLVWSPTNNYDPSRSEGPAGSQNHRFDPKSDPANAKSSCLATS